MRPRPPQPRFPVEPGAGTGRGRELRGGAGSSGPATLSGTCLAVAAGRSGEVRLVDPGDPGARGRLVGRHGARVTALVSSGGLLFSAGCDGRVLGWTLGTPSALSVVVGFHRTGVTAAAMGADGRLVTAGHDGEVRAWRNAASQVLAVHPGGVETFAVLPPGARPGPALVTAGRDGRLLCHDPGGAVELRRRRRELTLAALPLGRGLITGTGQRGAVRLWEDLADSGRPDELGVHGTWVLGLVAPDADSVAAVGGDHVTLWDRRTGDARRIDLGTGLHATAAVAVAGGRLAVVAPEGAVQVLDLDEPRP